MGVPLSCSDWLVSVSSVERSSHSRSALARSKSSFRARRRRRCLCSRRREKVGGGLGSLGRENILEYIIQIQNKITGFPRGFSPGVKSGLICVGFRCVSRETRALGMASPLGLGDLTTANILRMFDAPRCIESRAKKKVQTHAWTPPYCAPRCSGSSKTGSRASAGGLSSITSVIKRLTL